MDAVLTQYFGLTLDQTLGSGLENLAYFPETDCCYTSPGGIEYAEGFLFTDGSYDAATHLVRLYDI